MLLVSLRQHHGHALRETVGRRAQFFHLQEGGEEAG